MQLTSRPLCLAFLIVALFLPVRPSRAHRAPNERLQELSFQIALVPGSAALHLKRADLHRQVKNWQEARVDLETAARLDPEHDEIYRLLGQVSLAAGEPRRAKAELDRYLSGGSRPRTAEASARILRARAMRLLGRPLEAVADYEIALSLAAHPGPAVPLELADALREAGPRYLDNALEVLDQASATVGPLLVFESRALAIEVERQRYDAALERVASILEQVPHAANWHFERGKILEFAGRVPEAHTAFRTALSRLEQRPLQLRKSAARQELHNVLRARLALIPEKGR